MSSTPLSSSRNNASVQPHAVVNTRTCATIRLVKVPSSHRGAWTYPSAQLLGLAAGNGPHFETVRCAAVNDRCDLEAAIIVIVLHLVRLGKAGAEHQAMRLRTVKVKATHRWGWSRVVLEKTWPVSQDWQRGRALVLAGRVAA